jgi:hypothetical protein
VSSSGSLEAFAKVHGLPFREGGSLPRQGNLLSRGGRIEGLVEGTLPGGIEGTLAYYTYTYETTDSDGHSETHTRCFTIVVTTVPQSIGFMPSLGFAGAQSEMSGVGGRLEEVVKVNLGAGEQWTRRLFSPALVDWLAGEDRETSPGEAAPA